MNAFIGRALFALIFVGGFYNKYENFGTDGGSTIQYMSPKVSAVKTAIEVFASAKTGSDFKIPNVEDKHLLMGAMFLEGAGALLYVFGSKLGARMLMLFLLIVTPIMHDFWNIADPKSSEYQMQLIMFLKNLAMFGSLMTYVAMKKESKAKRVTGAKKTN
mmetsp:Transcript_32743/g.45442  ORF Transcript_32743/g.45442 Transcript_32743/m.45442 type:complete len:160 (-) Transcript_32743:194-673(-)|eukprot:CAMPEP_0196579052 /NCGR_PEP_ID=MMETSP1081-20130531/16644_1 /TAXON_ID=36882 /ORGANISM="Pyramimonas amylifera, Strain CCMP720" /LENGTH=159 /DNA_ID=CAMNT_0041898491 /DNA_START=71 /DNA_END=550 /DNA_ORIENTATION=-